MIIDTHTHLYLPEFEAPAEVVERALAAGVGHMIFPNVDLTTVKPMQELHKAYSNVTSMAMGLHPTEINANWESDLATIKNELGDGSDYVAIGEIGIDLYWDKTFAAEQQKALAEQLKWAVELNKPVILHCREGLDSILEVMDSLDKIPEGVFHSFGGDAADVERIRRRGDFYFGINGIVTFKNSRLREVLPAIGIERLLLETDSPYLAPVPHRGKRNESAYIVNTCDHIASTLGLPSSQVAEITTANARTLFSL